MADAPAPFLALHHVGFAVAEIAPATERYVALYGYEVASPVIHEFLQTAYVQFVQLARDSSYLEFVAPDSPESKLTRAARKGGGLNHLCYTAGPLEAEIARLEEAGMRLIGAPVVSQAFAGRRICWLLGEDNVPVELVERRDDGDLCVPG